MPSLQRFESRGRFKASPEALWPLLADTPTLNRAMGMPPIEYQFTPLATGGSTVEARVKVAGLTLAHWTEHPFLWREPYGYVFFRDFHGGPFARITGGVDVEPLDAGADLRIFAEFTPRNAIGTAILGDRARPARDRQDAGAGRHLRPVPGRRGREPVPDARPEDAAERSHLGDRGRA